MENSPAILILYQFYSPDDVVAGIHNTQLAEGLAARNFEVEAWPCNRSRHHEGVSYSTKKEILNGVTVRRVWRPAFNQNRFLGRILNSIWVEGAWKLRALLTRKKPDIVLIGTDPIFAVLLAILFHIVWPKTKIVHWCFDLYPEYAIAEGLVKEKGFLVRGLKFFLRKAYAKCDLVVDIGSCMRERLAAYGIKCFATLTPWALEEPSAPMVFDAEEREALFGKTPLGLLYSGNFSRVHEFYLTLKLARLMGHNAVFCYATRGARLEELKKATNPEDKNLRFADFAPPEKLAARLSAPDVHLVSLRPQWVGLAVPSKFFGALAIGRPVLFEGPKESAIARWIEEYKVGWVLTADNLEAVAEDLQNFSRDPGRKGEMFKHCHQTYLAHFSRKAVLDGFDQALKALL